MILVSTGIHRMEVDLVVPNVICNAVFKPVYIFLMWLLFNYTGAAYLATEQNQY